MNKFLIAAAGLIALHIVFLLNLQFTAWPEMLSFPYVLDKGFVIYKDFHHVYQPLLTYILLGVYKVFGFNLITLKVFTYVLIGLVDLMVFLSVRKLTGNNKVSIITLFMYVLLQPVFDGNMLWYDIGVILPILLSIYFINTNLFLTGLFVSIAFSVKQQAVLIVLPMFIYLMSKKAKLNEILHFIFGGFVPLVVLGIFLYKLDIFREYYFWTFQFPVFYLPKIQGYSVSPSTNEIIILLLMAIVVIAGLVLNYKKVKSTLYVLLFCCICLVLSAFPRFSLFHLQPALAVFVLIAGYLLSLNKKYFILILVPLLFLWKNVLINPIKEARFYSDGEFKFAESIKKISGNEKVYFLGPSSVYYVLTETVAPKPWIENYVWHFEIPGLQEKVINGWEVDSPKYIYWSKPENGAWYDLGTYQPVKIVEYIRKNYVKQNEIDGVEIWKLNKI